MKRWKNAGAEWQVYRMQRTSRHDTRGMLLYKLSWKPCRTTTRKRQHQRAQIKGDTLGYLEEEVVIKLEKKELTLHGLHFTSLHYNMIQARCPRWTGNTHWAPRMWQTCRISLMPDSLQQQSSSWRENDMDNMDKVSVCRLLLDAEAATYRILQKGKEKTWKNEKGMNRWHNFK